MIPALLIWLYKKFICPALLRRNMTPPALPELPFLKKSVMPLIFLMLLCPVVSAQDNMAVYRVMYNGSQIGTMQVAKTVSGDDLHLKMVSKISTRLLFKINVNTTDLSHFSKGRLLSSSVVRTVNGKEKANKKTWLCGGGYRTIADEKAGVLRSPISYNMMLLYCKEPVNIKQVYSDNHQQFLDITRTGLHSYRIKLPDGNYNDYYFENGVCSRVDVHHSMYSIRMELAAA
ncbi:hypothetical protein C7T94_07665 [Pedobacter yulinensis]|uniref:DUF3108 domain-containing protein n=1 Tax=Pedobacter yulinensis TaxID=2126353 RepID=A0A2T3HJI4_9SPHI|nr:DUF6134 family protein [Pedobacter yulinensis]PST82541.1 hypothetical protein C7T94_07665 [Pedobacter yulinensis]